MQAAVCFLFLLVAGISAKPISYKAASPAGSCGSTPSCELPSKIKFAYEQGKTYTYEVSSSVKTTTTSSDAKQAGLQVSAVAKIGAIQNCELELELSNVELKDEQGNKISEKRFVEDLAIPLRFEWNDGRIGDVCPTDEKDSQWSLNFKRSVLSALQNSMDSLDNPEPTREVDAAGECWANYEVESSDANRKVIKWTKDLNQCADRQGGMHATYGIKYTNPMSDINTMPLTEGKQTCKQTTEKRIIRQVECSERLEFLPTRLQEGAVTVVTEATMRVKLTSENNEQAKAAPAAYVTDLKFDHSYVPAELDGDSADAEKLIEKMCQDDAEVVVESGRDYSDLLDSLRSLSKEELAKVYNAAAKCKATQKMMQKVMPDVATTAAASFIVEKVEKNEPASSVAREDWLAALRGVLSPAAEILDKAAALVVADREYTVTGRAYLGVGSALNNFCARNKNCESRAEVKAAVARFAQQLAMCKSGSNDRDVIRRAIYSLRALGNAGSAIAKEAMPEMLVDCMTNKALPAEVRLSALSVMRRIPCGAENDKASETLRNVIRDSADDSEFRSYALVAAMRCPCLRDVDAVRSVISDESKPVNAKFGAFAVSFIARMEESPMSNYWEPEFRSTVSALMATRQAAELAMQADATKTGSTFHRQQFYAKLNAGYMYDVDMIHSDKSMVIPRNFRFNLSMAAFGRAINPIELGFRQEGLESLIEAMPSMEVFEKPQGDSLIQMPRLNTEAMKPVLEKLKMSLYVRVFGSEVRYAAVDKEVMDRLRQRLNERLSLDSASDEEGRQAAELFVDRALSLPTVAGLPLRLAIRGSYRSQVRPSLANPEAKRDSNGRIVSLNLKGDVKAGLSVELRSSMSAFIGGRQFGVQAVTRLVSKSEYKPEIVFEGRHLKLKVDMPSKIVRAASISNEVVIRRDKTEEPIVIDGAVRKAEMCTPGLSGVKICANTEVPSRWNGLMTPGKLSISFEKIDEQMKGIELEFRADHTVDAEGKIDTINFKSYVDTPGSTKDRKFLAELTVSRPARKIDAVLETPWKKASFNAQMTGDQANNEIKATLAVGEEAANKRNYAVAIKRSSSSVSEGDKTYPKRSITVEVTRSDVPKAILKASGSVTDMGDMKEVSVSVAELHIPNYYTMSSPASLNGEFGKNDVRGIGFMLKGKTEIRDFETEFGIKLQPEGNQLVYSHRLHHQSSAPGVGDDKFDRTLLWEVEFRREPAKLLHLNSVLRSMDVPIVSRAAHRLTLRLERPTQDDLITELDIELGHGAEAKRFKIAQKVNRHEMSTMRGFNYALTVSGLNMIDRTIAINYHREWAPKRLLQLDAEVRRGDIAIYHVSLHGRRDEQPGFGEFKFRTYCPYSDFLLEGKGEKTDDYTSVHSLRLERNGDLRVKFVNKARMEDEKRQVDASLELMGMAPITLTSRGEGSPFDGKWQHDAVLAYGARKLMFGGNVNYKPVSDAEGILDANVYMGTLERMFKQYVNWHRVERLVKVNGMTELGDDMYKVTAELDMATRRHRVLVEGPKGSTEVTVGRIENQPRGFEATVHHSSPAVEFQIFSKLALDKLRSDVAGHMFYRLAGEEKPKMISFGSGYKLDMSEGFDLGVASGIKINNRDWFINSNVTVIPGRKIALSFGNGDGDNYRHKYTIMGARKWESDNLLRLDAQIELHCTALQMPRLMLTTYKKISYNNEGRFAGYETKVIAARGEHSIWYTVHFDAKNPREAMVIAINGDSTFSKRGELKLEYSAKLPTVLVLGNVRYGERAGRVRGLVEVSKAGAEGVDVMYSLAAYIDRIEEAIVAINGKHSGDWATMGSSAISVDVLNNRYAVNSEWKNGDKKSVELVIRTPHENYRENVIRIGASPVDSTAEMLFKVGPKNVRLSAWRKVDETSRHTEIKADFNGRIYAVSAALDHPENALMSRGEHRLRLRLDTPVEGYKTSTMLFWIKPCKEGLAGYASVLGMRDAPEVKELRSQMQIAYQIGDERKGAVMMSFRGERNYETKKLFRELSVMVNLPRFNFSVDMESTRQAEKANGWLEYRSARNGNWRTEWTATGSFRKAGSVHVELRGKTPERAEPIIVSLSGNHDLSSEKKEIAGQIATSLEGFERVRLRTTHALNEDDGMNQLTVELMLPSSKLIKSEIAYGVVADMSDIELRYKLETPFEEVRDVAAELKVTLEAPKLSVDLKFHRNERKYVIALNAEKEDGKLSGDFNIETPFDKLKSASGKFERTGSLFSADGSKTNAEVVVNKEWTLKVDSEGNLVGPEKFISTVIKTKDDEYKLEINKKPGTFVARLPMPYCTIHYEGEISTANNIHAVLRRLHTCSPYSFAGELTVSLADAKQLLLTLETPIPYFTKLSANITYEFDDAMYMIEEKMPPTTLHVNIDREGHKLSFEMNANPEEKSTALKLSVRGVTASLDARVGNPEGGNIDLTIETPYVNIEMHNKREGPWSKPSSVEASLTAAGLDIYSLTGNWDVESYPQSFSVNIEGAAFSKLTKVAITGTTEGMRNWKRTADIKFGTMSSKSVVEMAGNKIMYSYENSEKKSIKMTAQMDPSDDGAKKTLKSSYEVAQSGYSDKFSSFKWDTTYSIPSGLNPRATPREIIMTLLTGIAWNQKLTVDGAEKYSTEGSLVVLPPTDLATMAGVKVEYESTRAWNDKKYHVVLKINKPQATTPTEVKMQLEVNGEKKVDVSGSIERREKFTKYARVKLDFEAPKAMSFDIERDATNENERVWKAKINFDKNTDAEGTQWQLNVKPADGVSARGFDLVLSCKRPDMEYMNIEAGYQRSLTKTFDIRYHLFAKAANMDKKYGIRHELSLDNMVLTNKVDFATLTRDVKVDMKAGYEPAKRMFINAVYDLGTPAHKLEANFEWQGEKVTGTVKLGDKVVNIDGTMAAVDRNNYEVKVNVRDNEASEATFTFKKSWSEESRNRTYDATLKTNKGEIEWHSHRYLADPIRSRGILVRYRKSEWPAGEETVLYAFGEVNMAAPSLKVQILSPFRKADYTVNVERREDGVFQVVARLIEDDGKVAVMTFERDPVQRSFDFLSVRADGSRLKVHGHIVSTKYAFFEAKRMMEKDGTYENLVRATISLDLTQLHANLKYNTELPAILREYISRRRDQTRDLMARYKENIPEGAKSIREIMMIDQFVAPFVASMRAERRQLRENERAKWREIAKEWYDHPSMKKMFTNRVPEFADSMISRWLSDEPLFAGNGDSSLDRALVAIGQALREFVSNDLIRDMKELREKAAQRMAGSKNTVVYAMARVKDTARDYVIEALDRLRERTWTSCLVRYIKMLPERVSNAMGDREDLREVRERLSNAVSKVRTYFTEMKERYLNVDSTANPVMEGIRETIAKSEITYGNGEIDAKIPLPPSKYRSLRTPASLASRVEGVREILERGVAAVKARLANPKLGQMTLRRVYGMLQYFKTAELKYLFL